MIFANVISAVTPYSTYTYSINGDVLESPDAYVPDAIVDSEYIGLDEDSLIDALADVEVDDKNNVYLVETTQNRVIVLDRYYKLKYQITEFVNEQMIPDKFNNPQGVFVSSEYIYVCDAGNARIVMFDLDGNYVKTVLAPESNLFDEGDIYTPVAVAVDDYGRMFVVSSTTNQGIIVMGDDGEFFGFIGAQKVTYNAIDLIWNTYFKKNAEGLVKYVPTEYNNITIDEKNFIYVTISSIDPADQQSAITSKSKSGDYAPVKKLNASGTDVMRRNGFYPPSGEVKVSDEEGYGNTNPSKIIDVAVGPEGTSSLMTRTAICCSPSVITVFSPETFPRLRLSFIRAIKCSSSIKEISLLLFTEELNTATSCFRLFRIRITACTISLSRTGGRYSRETITSTLLTSE